METSMATQGLSFPFYKMGGLSCLDLPSVCCSQAEKHKGLLLCVMATVVSSSEPVTGLTSVSGTVQGNVGPQSWISPFLKDHSPTPNSLPISEGKQSW